MLDIIFSITMDKFSQDLYSDDDVEADAACLAVVQQEEQKRKDEQVSQI